MKTLSTNVGCVSTNTKYLKIYNNNNMSKNTLLQSYVLISELLKMTPNSTEYINQKQKLSNEELEVATKIKAKEAVKKCRHKNKTTTDKTHKVEVISNAINFKPDDAKRVDLDNNYKNNNNVRLSKNQRRKRNRMRKYFANKI